MNIQCKNCFDFHDDTFNICPHCGFEPGAPIGEVFYLYPGTLLGGRYAVGKVLGFGGFGITYKAWDSKLQTIVAVKEYYPTGMVNRAPGTRNVVLFAGNRAKEFDHGLARFIDEAKNMAKFGSHKNIVNVFEYFEENNSAYIVMEFLDGITLSGFLRTNPVEPETGVDLIMNIAVALRDIHAQGIIHRDVSPDNIFICHGGNIKLIDFGAARFLANDEEKLLTIILKPGFAPPEQYEKINSQGPWTDVYALGATLYYTVTGIKPEESTNRKIEDLLVPPSEVNPAISEELSNTILKSMAVDRHMRFQNIDEFVAGLQGKKKVLPLVVEKKRRKLIRFVGVAAAMLVVITGASIFSYNFNKEREAETLPDATVQMWYAMDEDGGTYKEDAFNGIIQVFGESFPNVTIELRGIPEAEYAADVDAALQNGGAPMIFESSGIEASRLEGTLDISKAITDEIKADSLFLKDNKEKLRLPLGFVAPVVYANTELMPTDIDAIGDVGSSAASREEFLDGTGIMLESDTRDYFEIQSALPGMYKLLRIDRKSVDANLTHYISAANCDKDETKVALRFIAFMYSDNAQDLLFVQNRSDSLPLNRRVLATFVEVYNDFEGFFENIGNYSFKAE